jgi:hypothetical protein
MNKPFWSSLTFAVGVTAATAARLASAEPAAIADNPAPPVETTPEVPVEPSKAGARDAGPTPSPTSTEAVSGESSVAVRSAAATLEAEAGKPSKGRDRADESHEGKPHSKDAKDGKNADKLTWLASPKVRVGGLLHAQFAFNDAPNSADNGFRLSNARIVLQWRQGSLLDAVGEVELSRDGDREATGWAPMRDAYVRVSFDPGLRMRMGQFKRPFGRLSLTPLRDLKLIRRGISDVWINEELRYGERDVGFMVDGRFGQGIEVRYALGIFNGTGRNHRDDDPNGAKDFVGRLESRLGKHVSLAVNAANKRFDRATPDHRGLPDSAWMTGGDVLVEVAGLYGLIEGQYGSNYESAARHHTSSLLGLLAYKIPITEVWEIVVEPLVKAEILRTETEVQGRRILNGTAGANLYVGDIFRLMVQGEWIAPEGRLPQNLSEAMAEKRLILQAGMYTGQLGDRR